MGGSAADAAEAEILLQDKLQNTLRFAAAADRITDILIP